MFYAKTKKCHYFQHTSDYCMCRVCATKLKVFIATVRGFGGCLQRTSICWLYIKKNILKKIVSPCHMSLLNYIANSNPSFNNCH